MHAGFHLAYINAPSSWGNTDCSPKTTYLPHFYRSMNFYHLQTSMQWPCICLMLQTKTMLILYMRYCTLLDSKSCKQAGLYLPCTQDGQRLKANQCFYWSRQDMVLRYHTQCSSLFLHPPFTAPILFFIFKETNLASQFFLWLRTLPKTMSGGYSLQ